MTEGRRVDGAGPSVGPFPWDPPLEQPVPAVYPGALGTRVVRLETAPADLQAVVSEDLAVLEDWSADLDALSSTDLEPAVPEPTTAPRRPRALLPGLVAGGLAIVAHQVALQWLVPGLDAELDGLETWRPPTTVEVMDGAGAVGDRFSMVRREWVPIDELPPPLLDAVVVAEDRRFFEHGGVDLTGILRAALTNLSAGEWREGGSTITQQVVKNVIVGNERSLSRKLREALLALRLEQRVSKRRILELYLNLIYLGSGNYGVEAAARDYFGHSARDVDWGEAALLAGLIPSPSRFTPRSAPQRARMRRALVLAALVEEGKLPDEEAEAAGRPPIEVPDREPRRPGGAEGYHTAVRRQVRTLLGKRVPFEAGLRVHTALDRDVQASAEAAIEAAVAAVEARQGRRLARPGAGRPEPGCEIAVWTADGSFGLDGLALPVADEVLDALVFDPTTATSVGLLDALQLGDELIVCGRPDGAVEPAWRSEVEGAAVVMEYATGRVLALVGGTDMPMEGFNRATRALRQAGSAFKPFVYGAAFDLGRHQLDVILDGPLSLDAGGHELWIPQNASRGFWGPVALRWAFAYSLNVPAVRLAMDLGTAPIIRRAEAAGLHTELRRDLTLALGTSEVRPLELAAAVAGIVRGGVAVEPVLIERLEDARGSTLAEAGEPIRWPGVEARLGGGEGERFLEAASAWQVVDMMRAAVERGTGRAAFEPERDRGGKTGTTSDYRDAWFVGFDGPYLVAVWIGQDDGVPLGRGESGDRAALPAWRAIADALPEGSGPRAPPDVIAVPLGREWVDVAADAVPTSRLRFEFALLLGHLEQRFRH